MLQIRPYSLQTDQTRCIWSYSMQKTRIWRRFRGVRYGGHVATAQETFLVRDSRLSSLDVADVSIIDIDVDNIDIDIQNIDIADSKRCRYYRHHWDCRFRLNKTCEDSCDTGEETIRTGERFWKQNLSRNSALDMRKPTWFSVTQHCV